MAVAKPWAGYFGRGKTLGRQWLYKKNPLKEKLLMSCENYLKVEFSECAVLLVLMQRCFIFGGCGRPTDDPRAASIHPCSLMLLL